MKKLPRWVRDGLWGISGILIITIVLFILTGGSGYFFPIALFPVVVPGVIILTPFQTMFPEASLGFVYIIISVVFYFMIGVLFGRFLAKPLGRLIKPMLKVFKD